MNHFVRLAMKLSQKSDHPQYKLGAVVVRGGSVVSASANLGRFGRCAERRALRPNMDLTGCTLYVARANGRISKPCGKCLRAIVEAGIKWLIYVDSEGLTEQVRVSEIEVKPEQYLSQIDDYFKQERW